MNPPNTPSFPLLQPYLFFNGRCAEALAFYKIALDAEIAMQMRFGDAPDQPPPGSVPEGWENKIMHAQFRVGGSCVMASDGCEPGVEFKGFSLSIAVTSEADADKYFNALADGGNVTMPLGKTFWSPRFGMLTDRFGIGWMINVVPAGEVSGG